MATTKRIVDATMKGEDLASRLDTSSFTPSESLAMPTKAAQQYVVFRLVRKKQRRLHVDGIGQAFNKKETLERIWLLRGAPSIWQSELVEFLKDKEYVKRNRISLDFMDGICRVPAHDHLMLEYARANIHNVGKQRNGAGKYDYYEYDAAEEQKMRYDQRMKRINLITSIGQMEEEKMVKLALFLGVKPYDDEVGLPRTPDGFRAELLVLADTKPDIVLKYMDSREVDVSYLVRKAIMEGKIDLGGQTGTVIWAGNGGFIGKIPQTRKPIEYLTELALTNSQEGKQFKEQLETIALK